MTQKNLVKELLGVKELDVEFSCNTTFKGITINNEELTVSTGSNFLTISIEREVYSIPNELVNEVYYWSYSGKENAELVIETTRIRLSFEFEKLEEK